MRLLAVPALAGRQQEKPQRLAAAFLRLYIEDRHIEERGV